MIEASPGVEGYCFTREQTPGQGTRYGSWQSADWLVLQAQVSRWWQQVLEVLKPRSILQGVATAAGDGDTAQCGHQSPACSRRQSRSQSATPLRGTS